VKTLLAGARLAGTRLMAAETLAALVIGVALAALIAVIARAHLPLEAPHHLVLVTFRFVIPLTSFAIVARAIDRARLDDSVWCLARHGLAKQTLAFGLVLTAQALAALVAALVAAAGLLLAYGSLARASADLATTLPIALLGGAAYAGWFALGAAFLREGRGRFVPLVADFVLGGGTGLLAFAFPRSHLASLAGEQAVMDMSQRASSVMLLALTLALPALAAMRAGR
jgi:hypothetical protein